MVAADTIAVDSGRRTSFCSQVRACYNPAFTRLSASFRALGVWMKSRQKLTTIFAVGCLCLVFLTIPAYGYTDPNTVGLLSQILTPLLITAGACLTFLRKSIVDAFAGIARRFRRRSDV
jgi:hypothetical protein